MKRQEEQMNESGRLSDSVRCFVFLADYGIVEYAGPAFWLAGYRRFNREEMLLLRLADKTSKNHFLFLA